MGRRIVFMGIGLLWVMSGYSQSGEKGKLRYDTIVRTEKVEHLEKNTPRGEKNIYRNISPRKGTWSVEGSYGMAFGDQTTFNATAQMIYSQSVYFAMGGGLSYNHYYSSHHSLTERANYLGINLLARIKPFPYLAFQFQPELLERWGKQNGHSVSSRWVPTLLAGGGFFLPVGPGSIYLMFFFDIIQNKYTPYGKNLYYTLGYSFRLKK